MNYPAADFAKPFIPAKDFKISLEFYKTIGFEVMFESSDTANFQVGKSRFLLQNFYAKEWAENFMIQLEVHDVQAWWQHLSNCEIETKFGGTKLEAPQKQPWGATVSFLHDPSGVLWHLCQFDASK
ncbi:MAG: VOC family protein [Verrucomicrobiota bacterium]